MTIVAHKYNTVVGVDTHARTHTAAVLDTRTGRVTGTKTFPATAKGLSRLAARAASGPGRVLVVIEGVGSYGAKPAQVCADKGLEVVEPGRMGPRDPRGKDDRLDAERIARSVLGADTEQLRDPRQAEGARAALRVLLTARDMMNKERTAARNALTALLRTMDLGVDARRAPDDAQTARIAAWRDRDEPTHLRVARKEAVRLARKAATCDEELKHNERAIAELVGQTPAAPLTAEPGVGPITAATVLVAYSHKGRVRSESAFAALAGTNPIPASSGNTTRHRLNRGGDRQLNRALHTIATTRLKSHPETIAYAQRRLAEGKTPREIKRCIKRYLARKLYRQLNNPPTTPQPTPKPTKTTT
jgi:transposase